MKLNSLICAGLAGIAAVLLFSALFVPWQGLAFFGFSSDAGLWNVRLAGFGGSEDASWSDLEDEPGDAALIRFAAAWAVVATVAAFGTLASALVMAFRQASRWWPGGSAILATASCVLALVLFEAGLRDVFGGDGQEFEWAAGARLVLSGAVFLSLSALTVLVVPDLARIKVTVASE